MAGRRRPRSLEGTHLHVDERTGIYVWRRTDPRSGKRIKRSTGSRNFEIALRKAGQFEEELQRQEAGLDTHEDWSVQLLPLVDEWASSRKWTPKRRRTYVSQVRRALQLLNLRTAADLADLRALNRRFLGLQKEHRGEPGASAITLSECVQHPLKLFSKWLAENHRYLDRDPLRDWRRIDTSDHVPRASRAMHPDEVARAFAAARSLDRIRGGYPLQPVFLALLVTAPRATKLCDLVVADLDVNEQRLAFGEAVGKKLAAAGALDEQTFEDLSSYRGGRTSGYLFLSRSGSRLELKNLLRSWREAVSLGLVDELWPPGELRCLGHELAVSRSLITGRPYAGLGGNPRIARPETQTRRAELRQRVERIKDSLSGEWTARMSGVTVHGFRTTLQTWAEEHQVPGLLIDKQLGHRAPARDAALAMAQDLLVSRTGRQHYFDPRLSLIHPKRVAEAVRGLLDVAEQRLGDLALQGATALDVAPVVPKLVPTN